MRIYSMTATFGKLEHQTLQLTPGLNIIEAPNEWGKSTWCAFLVAMLYGIETRLHSTKTALADKERYAPWSGAPMSGRIDLNWNGMDITIERKTKGRSIFGDFKAYETATGIALPELTAANCGQQLLGVEREVFIRAGFIRLENMPVTEDEALRRRLNALVTTGDESGTAEVLERRLKELKNRCRFHKTGLLPQAQARAQTLEEKLAQITQLQSQLHSLTAEQEQLKQQQIALNNHQTALSYATAQANAKHLAAAEAECLAAAQQAEKLETVCAALPDREETRQKLAQVNTLQRQLVALQLENHPLPDSLALPDAPLPFRGLSPEQALEQASRDKQAYDALTAKVKQPAPLWLVGLLLLAAGCGLLLYKLPLPGLVTLGLGAVVTLTGILLLLRRRAMLAERTRQARAIQETYGTVPPGQWLTLAQDYRAAATAQAAEAERRAHAYRQWSSQIRTVQAELDKLTQGTELSVYADKLRDTLAQYNALDTARQTLSRLKGNWERLRTLDTNAPPPEFPDTLTLTAVQTAEALAENAGRQHQLQLKLGQCMGQMEQLGQESTLRTELDGVYQRIHQLEDTFAALTLAQQTLSNATLELQRRFAPQITQRAQQLFSRMTGGRYDRLTLSEDFRVNAAAVQEDTLHAAQWRSEGTVDQLYLALRLAVSEALTPSAPLVLDDALVRFDDSRLAAAMEILKEEAAQKQVILFTCQSREKAFRV